MKIKVKIVDGSGNELKRKYDDLKCCILDLQSIDEKLALLNSPEDEFPSGDIVEVSLSGKDDDWHVRQLLCANAFHSYPYVCYSTSPGEHMTYNWKYIRKHTP